MYCKNHKINGMMKRTIGKCKYEQCSRLLPYNQTNVSEYCRRHYNKQVELVLPKLDSSELEFISKLLDADLEQIKISLANRSQLDKSQLDEPNSPKAELHYSEFYTNTTSSFNY